MVGSPHRAYVLFKSQAFSEVLNYVFMFDEINFNISVGVVCSLPWDPCGLAVRRLPQMQEVVGSNPIEDNNKNLFFTFYSK